MFSKRIVSSLTRVPIEGNFGNLGHVCARRAPRIVARRCRACQLMAHEEQYVGKQYTPFRTLTWTDEYPLVTFFTLRNTPDMSAARGECARLVRLYKKT